MKLRVTAIGIDRSARFRRRNSGKTLNEPNNVSRMPGAFRLSDTEHRAFPLSRVQNGRQISWANWGFCMILACTPLLMTSTIIETLHESRIQLERAAFWKFPSRH